MKAGCGSVHASIKVVAFILPTDYSDAHRIKSRHLDFPKIVAHALPEDIFATVSAKETSGLT
jgi:hypothetical protein